MDTSTNHGLVSTRLRRGIVLRVQEDACEIFAGGQSHYVRYAPTLPSPHIERVSPGHLVAAATSLNGSDVVIWRWYDAVVLKHEDSLTRLWEPSHGELVARRRHAQQQQPGARAYLSAGLPGADWWVAGPVAATAEDADVELDAVEQFYNEHDLWNTLA